MIDKILEFSLRQRAFVLLAAVVLVAVGIWSAFRLPLDAVPEITNVQVQINTSVEALAAEEIEKLITFPIESALSGLERLVEMRSISRFGLSQVTLVFEDGADIYRARQLAAERLQNVLPELPSGTQPKLAPITTGLGEVFFYTIDYTADATNKPPSRHEQLLELRQIQEWTIKPLMRSVPGVAEINTSGGYEKQIAIHPYPEKMTSVGLSFEELVNVLSENVQNAGGGIVQRGGEQITIRSVGRVQTLRDIAELPIKFGAGVLPLQVKDVADVTVASAFRTGASTVDAQEAVVCWVLMLSGANSRAVAQNAHARLQEIQKKLPHGIVLRSLYDRSALVYRTVNTAEKNLFEGAVLVLAVLLALLGNWRGALIVGAAIPLSMLFALTGMVQAKVSGNLMSLGAVDFGLIVDGAVVIVENIIRHIASTQQRLQRPLTTQERFHAILSASRQVGRPMVFGVIIITIVYVPILALTGIEGKMFRPMALTVIFALIGSLLLAVTLIPALCSLLFRRAVAERENRVMLLLKHAYEPVLNWAFRFRWVAVTIAVTFFVASLFVFKRLGAEFIPQLDEGSTVLMLTGPASVGIDTSLNTQLTAEALLLRQFPEIAHVFSRIGTAEIQTDPMGANLSDTFIFFKPQHTWRKINGRIATRDQLAELMSKAVEQHIPGVAAPITQPIQMRFNELLEGARADIAVKIFGEDFEILAQAQAEARTLLESIRGTGDAEFDAFGKAPTLEITLNRTNILKYNVHAEEVNKLVSAALAGAPVGTFIDGNRRYDIVVRMRDSARIDFDQLASLPVRVREGALIPLSKVANIAVTQQVATINREAGQRRAAILVNLSGRDVQSWVNEAQQKISSAIKLPDGYFIEFGGAFKNLQVARKRLMIVVPLALALIFMLIFIALGSLRQSLLVYTGVPLAVTGGVFALWLRGLPFSISAGVGFIALSGVAVLNGLVMISSFNSLREEGLNIRAAVREGSLTRLRPVLMTALVASLGFIPMAIATGSGAEVQRPLATVVIGGIISSTFLTLVLLPALYEWIEHKVEKRAGVKEGNLSSEAPELAPATASE